MPAIALAFLHNLCATLNDKAGSTPYTRILLLYWQPTQLEMSSGALPTIKARCGCAKHEEALFNLTTPTGSLNSEEFMQHVLSHGDPTLLVS